MALLIMFIMYMCRINLSIAIVAMSKFNNSSSNNTNNNDHSSDACNIFNEHGHIDNNNQQQQQNHHGEFDWSESTQSQILGAFFYGYLVFQIVGGRLAELFGAKWLCAAGMAVSLMINAMTPLIARTQIYWLLVASRVVLGMFQAFILPSLYALCSKWAPDHERSTFLAVTCIGGHLGTVTTNALSGYLAEHGFAGGWPSIFYVSAIICSVWLLVWSLFITSEPTSHPCITQRELLYIESNIGANVYVVLTISMLLSGLVADFIERRKLISKTFSRKLFESFATIGSAICLAAIPWAQYMTNNFTATVFAIANTIAFTCGFITPLVIGYIVEASPDQRPRRQWSYIFYISAAISVLGGIVFLVFGSADRQPWDRDDVVVVVMDDEEGSVVEDREVVEVIDNNNVTKL
ncbi:putative inorganic phosphate cotransporter [Oppia nitens]|uniref:putative inorganic phosphate cotransporter n=1 Tax=Oppia nitens TaxID=1686743 RepID=UPI0023D9B0C5|nr:putative inorganic phosphate cotransporter [Oppia nitens]